METCTEDIFNECKYLPLIWSSLCCCSTFQERPAEKPICICISNIEQLLAAKPPFSPLLWEFMRNVYPGGISCIVSKGDWLLRLGLKCSVKSLNNVENKSYLFNHSLPNAGVGPAIDRVGTRDSIMIRVPDHTVTAHLCDITGPLAITSANPSGEPDSTHHDMVIRSVWSHWDHWSHYTFCLSYHHHHTFCCALSRLGHKIQGVLCDGNSNQVVASTVVNCLRIDEGKL